MSRKAGIRGKPELYGQILAVLEEHPEGMIAYHISVAIGANDCTVRRKYLADLVEQEKVVTVKEWNKRRIYFLNKDCNNEKTPV
jgi:hypothetical protein